MEPNVDETLIPPTPDQLKEKGNECVRKENFPEAVLHYSQAIKMSPLDPILYSNRSLAFLKMKQLYYANCDADKAIQLKPDWAKGYFRKGEVQSQANQYDVALLSYGAALQFQPNDINILVAAKKAAAYSNHNTLYEKREPWFGAALGIVMGVIIVLADEFIPQKQSIKHPLIAIALIISVSIIGYFIAKCFRYYIKLQKKALLDPPIDLLEDFKKTDENAEEEIDQPQNRTRYSKAQARQRFKKGKT